MKRKLTALLMAAVCAASLSACAGKGENKPDENIVQETNTDADSKGNVPAAETDKADEADKDTETEGGEYEYPSEDAGAAEWESPLGYSLTYDPTVFTLDDTGEAEMFTYNTAENLDAPVYLSVQSYADMDAQTLAEGLALQSGMDGVEVQDANFGADGVESKLVYMEKEVDGAKQVQIFYAIPKGEGSLLVEMGSYAGAPMQVDAKMEEMLGTFTLN